ncbi:MAG: sodium-dependent transporter [Faecalimonas sp.]|nr:sodium-dependent transporter [Faecalimonas sp.]
MNKRSNFSSKIGFVLAAAGSAVGLGNIWRFPYLAAEYGGGTFLLVYVILAVTFGFTLMTAEIAIGRKTGVSAIEAFKKLDKRFGFLGILAALVPILIFPYYSVIGGWVMKYLVVYITGDGVAAAGDAYFHTFISSTTEPLGWFFLFIALTAIVVLCGVQKGIENVSKFMMPVLIVLTIIVAVYVCTLDGAMEGMIYYIKPNLKNLSAKTLLAASGQMFYSMSLAMGIMITYGSYLKKDNHIEKSVHQIEIFDTGIAFFSGLMVIPAVFAFSGSEDLGAGPGLMFMTLPKVFHSMPFGDVIGALFFILVLFAALTSSISLMETVVSIVCDKSGWKRKPVCLCVMVFSLLLGAPSSLGFGVWSHIAPLGMPILDAFDFLTNSVMMPVVAILTCIIIGFIVKPKLVADEVKVTDGTFKSQKLFTVMIKWICPIFLIAILASSILSAFGIFTL